MASPGFSPPTMPTVAAGGPATSAQANLWSEGVNWLASTNKTDSRPYAVLSASTTVVLTAATQTAILFDTEAADVGNGHTGSTATYTIPTAGTWMFIGVATYATSTSANVMISKVVINGSAIVAADTRIGSGLVAVVNLPPVFVGCSAGDTVQLTQQTSNSISTDITLVHPSLTAYWLNS